MRCVLFIGYYLIEICSDHGMVFVFDFSVIPILNTNYLVNLNYLPNVGCTYFSLLECMKCTKEKYMHAQMLEILLAYIDS